MSGDRPAKGISEAPHAVHRPTQSELISQDHIEGPTHAFPSSSSSSGAHLSHPPPYSMSPAGSSSAVASLAVHQRSQQQRQASSQSALPALPDPSPPRFPGLPRLDYSLYQPATFKLSADLTTQTSRAHLLCSSPSALRTLISSQATVPPKPIVRVKGTSGREGRPMDFDFRINCMSLLLGDDHDGDGGQSGADADAASRCWNYVRTVGSQEMAYRGGINPDVTPDVMGVDAWVNRFCADSAALKQFTIERTVINWDKEYISGRILSLIVGMGYSGTLSVTFPVQFARVTVHSPDRVNRFISNVQSIFTGTKTYETVKVVWPYADRPGGAHRRFVVQSEEAWWAEWRDPIRYAVANRRFGWVTAEDRLEFLMAPGPLRPALTYQGDERAERDNNNNNNEQSR